MRSNCRLFIVGLVSVLMIPTLVFGLRVKDPELLQKPNPHWTGKSCLECHDKMPEKGKAATYKHGGDFVKLCNNCHDTVLSRADEHVVGVKLVADNKRFKKPPSDFPLPDGKLSCITCHDLRLQEYPNKNLQEIKDCLVKIGLDTSKQGDSEAFTNKSPDLILK